MPKRSTKVGALAPVVIADGEATRTVQMRWGFERTSDGGSARSLIRDDNAAVDLEARCLIPASELPLEDREGRRWIIRLDEGEPLFCFAGLWRPASETWPASYAAVTVRAYPDIRFIKDRHLAIVPKSSWTAWLSGAPAASVLQPLPRRTLTVLPAG